MGSRIPVEALDEGAKLAHQNAWQYLDDAELLLSHGSYGHAIAFALYAFEEYAKMGVLRAMKIDPNLQDELSERIAMKKHVEKFWVALEGIRGSRGIELTDETKKQIIDKGQKLQFLKERGLYVDYNQKWLTPHSEDLKTVASGVISEIRELMSELDEAIGKWLET